MTPPISFLDLLNIDEDRSAPDVLADAVGVAQEAERLGYHRLWYAEHHNTVGLASATPELIINHIAQQTERIHVGAGGVMLPNHAPLRIVETFRLLNTLHPDRIDLGLGRAPGTDRVTTFALRRTENALQAGDEYPSMLAEMLAFEEGEFPDDHPFAAIQPVPTDSKLPPIWLLGSSGFSGQLAAQTGLGLSFAAHINRAAAADVSRNYRQNFQPSRYRDKPHSILAVSVVIGENDREVERLVHAVRVGFSRMFAAKPSRAPGIEAAQKIELAPQEELRIGSMTGNMFFGTADAVARDVRELFDAAQADELMITSFFSDPEARRRTLRSFAEAWNALP